MRMSIMKLKNGTTEMFREESYSSVAELAGAKLIYLQHKRGFGKRYETYRGFQGLGVLITESGGQYSYKYEYTKSNGEDSWTTTPVIFYPQEGTNELLAPIPDTEYNRDKLAKIMANKTPAVKVKDNKISRDIEERSKEYKRVEKVRKDKNGVLAGMQREKTELEKENEKLKRELENKKKASNIVGDALIQEKRSRRRTVRDEKKKEFYDGNKELIDKIKASEGDNWFRSKEYKSKVQTPIDKMVNEQLSKEGLLENADEGADS